MSGKYISVQFEDTCNLCFKKVNKGESVYWYGKGFGVRHINCYIKRTELLTKEEYDILTDW